MKAFINSIYSLPLHSSKTNQYSFKINEPNYAEVLGGGGELRRMSRLVKMGMYASQVCLNNSSTTNPDAILVGTGLGGVECSEKFLTGVLDNETSTQSPTPFIQSLPNSIAGQIAIKNSCYGYVMTYVHRGFSFETALVDAMMLLDEKKEIKTALVGGLDELTLNYVESMRQAGHLKEADENNQNKGVTLGEGATFLQISSEKTENSVARILGMELLYKPDEMDIFENIAGLLLKNNLDLKNIDLFLLGNTGDIKLDQKIVEISRTFDAKKKVYFKHQCGDYHTSSGFALQLAVDNLHAENKQYALIINHYRDTNYSIFLIEK